MITYRYDIVIFQSISQLFKRNNLKPYIKYEFDDETSIASMVSLDYGVGLTVNNNYIKPFDNIEVIHLNLKHNLRIVYLVYDSHQALSDSSMQLIDYLINNYYKL